jgi:hypothetical protein
MDPDWGSGTENEEREGSAPGQDREGWGTGDKGVFTSAASVCTNDEDELPSSSLPIPIMMP